MIEALRAHAAKHFQSYFIALLLGLSGWLGGIYDVFYNVEPDDWVKLGWWQKIALYTKAASTGIAAIIGYMMKSPLDKPNPPAVNHNQPPPVA